MAEENHVPRVSQGEEKRAEGAIWSQQVLEDVETTMHAQHRTGRNARVRPHHGGSYFINPLQNQEGNNREPTAAMSCENTKYSVSTKYSFLSQLDDKPKSRKVI